MGECLYEKIGFATLIIKEIKNDKYYLDVYLNGYNWEETEDIQEFDKSDVVKCDA